MLTCLLLPILLLTPPESSALDSIEILRESSVERSATAPIVLYFWASWCEPCALAWPDIEAYADAASTPGRVIAISDEDRERILEYAQVKSEAVAIGRAGEAFYDRFGIEAIPAVVLVDPETERFHRMSPNHLDETAVATFIDGGQPPSDPVLTEPTADAGHSPSVFSFRLTPSTAVGESSYGQSSRDSLEHRHVTVRGLISRAYGILPSRVRFTVPEPPFRYDLSVAPGIRGDGLGRLLSAALESALRVEVEPVEVERTVYVLSQGPDFQGEKGAASSVSREGSRVRIRGGSLAQLAPQIEAVTGVPVLTEDRPERMTLDIHIPDSFEALREELKKWNLIVVQRREPIQVLEVRSLGRIGQVPAR